VAGYPKGLKIGTKTRVESVQYETLLEEGEGTLKEDFESPVLISVLCGAEREREEGASDPAFFPKLSSVS